MRNRGDPTDLLYCQFYLLTKHRYTNRYISKRRLLMPFFISSHLVYIRDVDTTSLLHPTIQTAYFAYCLQLT